MRRKFRTLEALILLCLWAAAIRLLPVRYLLPSAKETGGQGPPGKDTALAVRGAIRSATARLPVKPTCLVQSLAAASMLRRRGLAHHLHIGARMDPDFQAHAWVEAGGLVVAGEGDVGSYSVLLTRER
jgi:hypothetical protein